MTGTVERILKNLEDQRGCYARLMEHMDIQLQAIADNDDEVLMQTIKDKSALIQKLNQLEKEARSEVEALSPADREQFRRRGEPLRAAIIQALEKLISREEACQEALIKKRAEVEAQILEFKKKKNLFEGYGGPPAKGGGFTGNA